MAKLQLRGREYGLLTVQKLIWVEYMQLMQIADIVIQKVSESLKKDGMTCGTLYDVSIVYKSLIGLIGPSDDLMSLDDQ